MRSTVQGCALLLLFLLAQAGFGVEPTSDATVLAQVVAAQQGHTTVQGRLRWQTRQIADPSAPVREQLVRFFLAFPARYHVVVSKPDDADSRQSYVSDGITRWEVSQLFAGEAPDKKAAPVGGDDEFERRLMACFHFDLASLQRDFTILAAATANGGAEIRLTPSAEKLKDQLSALVLTFDAKRVLSAIRSDDPQGNRLEFTVLEAVYDQPIDDAVFHVTP